VKPLQYHLAPSIAYAQSALAQDPEARLLGGGMTLIPALKHRLSSPSQLLDISRLAELRRIEVTASHMPNHVYIGAGMRHAEVAASTPLAKAIPALAQLAGGIGDPQVRARGTLGGSIANNDPAADYPAALLALKAVVVTQQRELAAEDFFQGMFTTALKADEIVTGVKFAIPKKGVYVADFGGGEFRVAVTGAASSVCRWNAAEAACKQGAATAVFEHDELLADIHAPAAYRAQLATLMFEQALRTLV
jgi:carbon-monoxide dehydrogenase medium subunit